VSAPHGREFNASCTWLQSLGSEVGVPLKERTKRIFAVFGAAWVAVWVLVLLTRTEASLAVRVGVQPHLVAGPATLVLTASRRRQPRWLDWAICVARAIGVCGAALCVTLAEAEWGPHSGWVRALWSAWLLVGAILPLYWTYKRRGTTLESIGKRDR
jgi:hypothetical protein